MSDEDKPLTRPEMATLEAAGYVPLGGGVYDEEVKVRMAFGGGVFLMTRAQWRTVIAELVKEGTRE
jgi:hypothetical protein